MTPSRRPSPLRRALRSCLLALAVLSPVHVPPVHAGWLAADPTYMGYRIPEHRWRYWTALVEASGNHSARPSSSDGENRFGVVFGRLGSKAGWGYDSDRLAHALNLGVEGSGGRSGSHLEGGVPANNFDTRQSGRSRGQRFSLDGSLRFYPRAAPVALTLSSSHLLDLGQSFSDADISLRSPPSRVESASRIEQGFRNYSGTLSAGIGVGRVRDATPVHRAQVIEDRLLEKGALARPLSPEARRKLAALHDVGNDIANAHQRPDKYFWRELERILREDGALVAAGLDAYDVFRLLEPLSVGNHVPRLAGAFLGPRVFLLSTRTRFRSTNTFSTASYTDDILVSSATTTTENTVDDRRDDVSALIGAEIHRPLSPRWQVDAYSTASIREAGEFPAWTNSLAVTYILSDRWFGNVRALHQASADGHSRRFDRWAADLSAELVYFLEDAWALRLSGNERQFHDRNGLQRTGGFQLGITYVVSGLFEAPGLIEPMRPTPPTP